MRYRTPQHRVPKVRAVADALLEARRVVLTTHVNADGDGCGCEAALAVWLAERGVTARIVNPTAFPDMYAFLLEGREELLLEPSDDAGAKFCRSADLAVVLDTGEKSRLGRLNPLLARVPRAVVDHHEPGEKPIEGLDLRDPTACAAGELVYDILLAADGGRPWPPGAVRGLYVAILTDTGSFRFSNTTAACHRIAADLLERGVDPEAIFRKVYATAPLRRYRLLRAALDHLEVDEEHGLAWMTVPRDAYDELGASADDLEGLVEYPRSIAGVEVAMIFRETDGGDTKISFRSNGPVNVNRLATRFGGGGHRKAAGALASGPLAEVRRAVLSAVREAVREGREGDAARRSAG